MALGGSRASEISPVRISLVIRAVVTCAEDIRTPRLRLPVARPHAGDVVVRSFEPCPTDYVLGPQSAPAQIRCSAYAAAFDVAKRWARRARVDVWLSDHDAFILLSRHRPDVY